MKFRFLALLAAPAAILLSACGGGGNLDIEDVGPGEGPLPARVVVTTLKEDRPFEQKSANVGSAPPFSFLRRFSFSRPEEAYQGSDALVPRLMAEEMAKALEESGLFSEVIYTSPDEMPERGTYDLHLRGTLEESTMEGTVLLYSMVLPLGVSFYDVFWYLGFPKLSRSYDYASTFQWHNGYTDAPIGDPISVAYESSRKVFWVYATESQLQDLKRKATPTYNQVVQSSAGALPQPEDGYWAQLRQEGAEHLAMLAREEEFVRRGSPAVFNFLAPVEGATLRGDETELRWSISAPNGLRDAALRVNGRRVGLNLDESAMRNADAAPRSIPAQSVEIPLLMGRNTVEATVTDWRGNEEEASLNLTRLPQTLNPEDRFALLVGMGSQEAEEAVLEMGSALRNPYAGQFEEREVVAVVEDSFDPAQLRSEISSFGRMPLNDDLAFIYIAAPADAETMSLGSGSNLMPITDLVSALEQSLATEDVILILDLDWNGEGANVMDALDDAPARWALAVSSEQAEPGAVSNGEFIYGTALAAIISDENRYDDFLTIDRMFDDAYDMANRMGLNPDSSGRYDPNTTIVSYR